MFSLGTDQQSRFYSSLRTVAALSGWLLFFDNSRFRVSTGIERVLRISFGEYQCMSAGQIDGRCWRVLSIRKVFCEIR